LERSCASGTAAAPAKHIKAIASARASVRFREKPTLSLCINRGIHPDNMAGTTDLSLLIDAHILYPSAVIEVQFDASIDPGFVLC
jgi:hypothetical protein